MTLPYTLDSSPQENERSPAAEGTLDDTKLGLLMSDLYEVVFQVN